MPFTFAKITLVLLVFVSINSHTAIGSPLSKISESVILDQLTTPLSIDSANMKFKSVGSMSFMKLIRLSLYSRTNANNFAIVAFNRASNTNNSLQKALSYMALLRHSKTTEALDSCLQGATKILQEKNLINLKMLAKLYAAPEFSKIEANYAKAFRLVNQFLAHYTNTSDHVSYARAWNTLGEVYRSTRNNQKALECYRKASKYAFQDEELVYASPLINIGTIYKNSEKYDSAFFYFDLVLSSDSSRTGSMYAYILNRKAQTFGLMGDHDAAFEYAKMSLALYEKIDLKVGEVLALGTLTKLEHLNQSSKKCTKYGERTIKLASQIDYYPEELLETCQILVMNFEKQFKFKKALFYQKIYEKTYSKLFDPEINRQMLKEQLALEMRNQELESSLLFERQEQMESKAKNQLTILLMVLVTLLVAGIALILFFKKNKKLAALNSKLYSLIEENNGLVHTIIHDLKSPLNSIQGLLLVIQNETKQNTKVSEFIQHGFRVLKSGHEIIQQLIELRAIEQKSYKLKTDSIEVKQFVNELKEDFDIVAKQKVIELMTNAEEMTISTDKILLRRILDNLVSNAVKFSPEGKQVTIKSWMQEDQVYFQVSDQGPGFNPLDMDKMYGKFQKLTARPTGGESSHGLGLATVDLLIKELKGTIQLETAVDQGASFTLGIPRLYPN